MEKRKRIHSLETVWGLVERRDRGEIRIEENPRRGWSKKRLLRARGVDKDTIRDREC